MTIKTTLEILVAARALIERPENWCQGEMVSWSGARCAMGAVDMASDDPCQFSTALHGLRKVIPLCGPAPEAIAEFNDTSTHAEVLTLFDRAIAAEKRKTDISVFTKILNTAGAPKQPANV